MTRTTSSAFRLLDSNSVDFDGIEISKSNFNSLEFEGIEPTFANPKRAGRNLLLAPGFSRVSGQPHDGSAVLTASRGHWKAAEAAGKFHSRLNTGLKPGANESATSKANFNLQLPS